MLQQPQDVILFQGDSVTDCGRNRAEEKNLGSGYPYLIGAALAAKFPAFNLQFYNRGVSGDRVQDLRRRWNEDCLQLKPTLLSILIGINDTWRRYDSNDPTSVEKYAADYHWIVAEAKEKLHCRVLILEPFLLPTRAEQKSWREDLNPKIDAAREIAREFGAVYVPLDGEFAAATMPVGNAYFAPDGVHPNDAGRGFIAAKWIAAATE
jgi:lysophospholipase L1-like esterase